MAVTCVRLLLTWTPDAAPPRSRRPHSTIVAEFPESGRVGGGLRRAIVHSVRGSDDGSTEAGQLRLQLQSDNVVVPGAAALIDTEDCRWIGVDFVEVEEQRVKRSAGISAGWDPLESTCRHASLSIL